MATHGRHTRFKANALATQALNGRMRQLRGSFTWNRYPHLGPQDLDTMEIVSWISNGETSLILDIAIGCNINHQSIWMFPTSHSGTHHLSSIFNRSFQWNKPSSIIQLCFATSMTSWKPSLSFQRGMAPFLGGPGSKDEPWLNGRTCFF